MNLLERVDIDGLWGDKKVAIEFYPDVNFLIGGNGSGKTTVINMIAAALSADFHTLDRLPFESIRLKLSEVGGRKKPSIEVEKKPQRASPYPAITYRIQDKASETPTSYSLDELEEEKLYRVQRIASSEHLPPRRYHLRYRDFGLGVLEHVNQLVNISWLSIHRTAAPYRSHEERSFESSVDQKLDELSTEFVKYFSLLIKQSTDEVEKFQQTIFLALLSDESEQQFFTGVGNLDIDKEKKTLIDIFRMFRLDERKVEKRINKHFEAFSRAMDRVNKRKPLTLQYLTPLLGTWRIHSVVQEWNKLNEKQKQIFEPRDTFLNVLNALLKKKKLKINDKNELEVITEKKKTLYLNHLSSGEKQLLIILGEGLLQEKAPWIYIADEPELSLHVSWQENLIHNLRRINPSAQTVFATHSPDIVSNFGKNVFDMEKIVK